MQQDTNPESQPPEPSLPNRRSISSRGSRIIAVYFLLAVSLPLILLLLGFRPGDVENATPAPAPEIAAGDILNTEMYEHITEWLEDRVPGRDVAVEVNASIDYEIFDTSPNPRVLVGADGWLYLRDGVEADCVTDSEIDDAVGEITRIERAMELTGRRFLVLIAPNKAAIYPEHLGEHATATACADANRAAFRTATARSGTDAYLDTWSVMESAKRATEADVYHRIDTHWNRLGTGLAAEAVVEWFAPGLWEPEALQLLRTEERLGDLVRLMGLSFTDPHDLWSVRRGNPSYTTKQWRPEGGPVVIVSEATTTPMIAGRALLLQDSMGEVIVSQLRPYLESLVTHRERDVASFDTSGAWFDRVLPSADVLVAQTVERSLLDRFSGGLERDVIGALANELPHSEFPLDPDMIGTSTDTAWVDANEDIISQGPDPQIIFDLPSRAAVGQYLVVDITPSTETTVQLFWSEEDGSFDATDSVTVRIAANEQNAVFHLGVVGGATHLRIDPGTEAGHRVSAIRIVDLGIS